MSAIDGRLGHRDRKLVSAHTGTKVGRAHDALKLLRDKAQGPVAGTVSLPVVDPLQVVEVDHHQ